MEPVIELKYALDTFYFLVMGAFVMLMACGFAMLEAGLVRGKNTAEILTKNIVLYSIACTMYLLCGYSLMYPAESVSALIPGLPSILGGADNDAADVISSGGDIYYSGLSDFFFQAVFVAAAGNQSNNNDALPSTPANVPGMISVGATTSSGDLASFSNFGRQSVHLFAPGERIVSSDAFSLSGTTIKSGTSQAAPMVSAAFSMFFTKKSKMSPAALERKLFDSSKSLPQLADLSVSGSLLASKLTRKVTRLSPKARTLRGSGSDVVTGRRIRDRFVGVLDPTTGASQKDVENDLLCKGDSYVAGVNWPFDNIAVFTVNTSSRRFSGGCRASSHRSDRVFDRPRKRSR